ncbi:Ribonucleases P/MRP protein subunit [Ceraceosorus bombacis]|uniref:Ribonucleases P/MRP protein subunit n=1 Tax=Ceraceosorus bombacis TaxID=401625 RepID=A0A0P1BLE9_9BASI|nr:Ribonucleases P/MRP protein subunit [Ceraceosorus bombacis]
MSNKRKLELALDQMAGEHQRAHRQAAARSGDANEDRARASARMHKAKKARFETANVNVNDGKAGKGNGKAGNGNGNGNGNDNGNGNSSQATAEPAKLQLSKASTKHQPRSKSSRHLSQAGSSRSFSDTLPSSLDLNQHLESHASQIRTISVQLKTGRGSSATRAWQMLPRAERRRAASHNLLALPKRLRGKGASELKSSNTTATTRKEVRKRKGMSGSTGGYPRVKERRRRERLRGRAGDEAAMSSAAGVGGEIKGKGRWLETHLWHAKRFRMTGVEDKVVRNPQAAHDPRGVEYSGVSSVTRSRWGYNLAEQPSSKGFKAAIKACKDGVAVHDASYWQSVRVGYRLRGRSVSQGKEARMKLAQLLRESGLDLESDELDARATFATLTEQKKQYVAPVTLLWVQPTDSRGVADDADALSLSSPPLGQASGRISEREAMQVDDQPPDIPNARTLAASEAHTAEAEVILLVHPAGLASLRTALTSSITLQRRRIRQERQRRRRAPTASSALVPSSSDCLAELPEVEQDEHVYMQLLRPASPALCAKSDSKGRKHGTLSHFKLDQKLRKMASISAQRDEQEGQKSRMEGYNMFQLSGPRSGRLLGSILKPVARTSPDKKHAFKLICSVLKPDQIRRGTMLGLQVHDPRLRNPSTVKKEVLDRRKMQQAAGALEVIWDRPMGQGKEREDDEDQRRCASVSATLAQTDLLSQGNEMPRVSKGEVDSLKARNLIPGTPLTPSSTTQIVSIAIIAHRDPVPGYTLLVPRGWGRAFFHSLVHSKPVVLCLSSLASLSSQFARPVFPFDHPGCEAYNAWEKQEVGREKAKWCRTPMGKRVNWESVGTRFAWGGEGLWKACVQESWNRTALMPRKKDEEIQVRLLPPGKAFKRTERYGKHDASLRHVSISAIRRGHFGPYTEIHMLTLEEQKVWRRALLDAPKDAQLDLEAEDAAEPVVDPRIAKRGASKDQSALRQLEQSHRDASNSLMGATTSGTFSLAEGKACAVGVIASVAVRELQERAAALRVEQEEQQVDAGQQATEDEEHLMGMEGADASVEGEAGKIQIRPCAKSNGAAYLVLTKERQSSAWRAAELRLL